MRRRIIEEASRLYHENGEEVGGVETTTVELICERADISVRTFFRHFDSKLDVIYLDYRRAIEDLVAYVSARLSVCGPERALLEGSLEQIAAFTADDVNRQRLIRALKSPHFVERRAIWRMRTHQVLADLIEGQLPEGPDRTLRAMIVVSAIRALVEDALAIWVNAPDRELAELMRLANAQAKETVAAVDGVLKSPGERRKPGLA